MKKAFLVLGLMVMVGCMEDAAPAETEVAQGICSTACGGLDFEDWSACIDASCGGPISGIPSGSWAEGPNNTRFCSAYWTGPHSASCSAYYDGAGHWSDWKYNTTWKQHIYCSNGSTNEVYYDLIERDCSNCGGGSKQCGVSPPF